MAMTTTHSALSRSLAISPERSTTRMVATALTNSDGDENNAMGDDAMFFNTTGSFNTAVGDDALDNNVDGNSNIAIGDEAGTGLGPSVNNCIAIGAPGAGTFATLDNTCFIGSIFDEPVSDPGTQEAVFVDQFNVVGIVPRPGGTNTTFNRWTRPAKPSGPQASNLQIQQRHGKARRNMV